MTHKADKIITDDLLAAAVLAAHDRSMDKDDSTKACIGRLEKKWIEGYLEFVKDEMKRDTSYADVATSITYCCVHYLCIGNVLLADPRKIPEMLEMLPAAVAEAVRLGLTNEVVTLLEKMTERNAAKA